MVSHPGSRVSTYFQWFKLKKTDLWNLAPSDTTGTYGESRRSCRHRRLRSENSRHCHSVSLEMGALGSHKEFHGATKGFITFHNHMIDNKWQRRPSRSMGRADSRWRTVISNPSDPAYQATCQRTCPGWKLYKPVVHDAPVEPKSPSRPHGVLLWAVPKQWSGCMKGPTPMCLSHLPSGAQRKLIHFQHAMPASVPVTSKWIFTAWAAEGPKASSSLFYQWCHSYYSYLKVPLLGRNQKAISLVCPENPAPLYSTVFKQR